MSGEPSPIAEPVWIECRVCKVSIPVDEQATVSSVLAFTGQHMDCKPSTIIAGWRA